MSKALALFDFDGTITDRDTLPDFIKFAVGKMAYYWGVIILSPWLLAYVLKLYPNDKAKEKMLGYYFKGWLVADFENVGRDYAVNMIPKRIRPIAQERLAWHRTQGHDIVVVTASLNTWVECWAKAQGYQLLSTKMQVEGDKLTGKFATANCYGKEKVNRIKAAIDLTAYAKIYAYGDSNGDKPMLALAHEQTYKPFRE